MGSYLNGLHAGDLVWWVQGECEIPGLVLEVKPAGMVSTGDCEITARGKAALVALPELNNVPEWFHECELNLVHLD